VTPGPRTRAIGGRSGSSAGAMSDGVMGDRRSLLGLIGEPVERIRALLEAARRYEPIANDPSTNTGELAGRTIANLFFEDSTRTRVSFALAAHRLGAGTVDLASGSSVSKGESIADSAATVEAMGVSALVVRARAVGAAGIVAGAARCPVINAGDGTHEHPTQALIDAYALAEAHGRVEGWDLSGVRVAIVGDVAHSRVARSNIACLSALGAEVVCVGPPGLAPRGLEALGCLVGHDLDAELEGVDAIMMLRVQFERHGGGRDAEGRSTIGSAREYRALYGLDEARAARLKPGAIVMHPGPVNRGLEIEGSVADGDRSVIRRQVALGVAVRMGVLRAGIGD